MNTLNKRIVLLVLALVIISISGYIISEKNTTGWDWEKYEKYSKFYDKINTSGATGSFGNIVRIEDFMVGMPQDTEFDKTWYFTFLYFKRGIEAYRDEFEKAKEERRTTLSTVQAQIYYKNATEYRKKIEEMKPRINIREDFADTMAGFELELRNVTKRLEELGAP